MNTAYFRWAKVLGAGAVVAGLVLGGTGCYSGDRACESQGSAASDAARLGLDAALLPMVMTPDGRMSGISAADLPAAGGISGPVFGTAQATITDTRTHELDTSGPWEGETHTPGEFLPPHKRQELKAGVANELPVGSIGNEPRVTPESRFPGIGQTEWVPPDPTLAVGPDHIVTTVNMKIAFYDKAGNQQYINWLNDVGNPGFFEPVGAKWFTFDPKCFYDHLTGRFVVIAPEVYGNDEEAWICIAVSDDSDPNGVWYLYRTDAVVWEGDQSYFWDFPGFGYDDDAFYVTSNLFGLNQGAWGGVGVRIFKKEPLLSGQAAEFWTLRDGGSATAQVAQHFGPNQTPYLVSFGSSSRLRIHAINDPITSPTLTSVDVTIPAFRSPTDGAPSSGGNTVVLLGAVVNSVWRDGALYATHVVWRFDGRNVARWYHLKTNNWPATGTPTLVETGDVDLPEDMHTYFPAIYTNELGQVGMVHGMSNEDTTIAVAVTGRNPGDPAGEMGLPIVLKQADVDGGGRWGDYYDIALDPTDNRTFWIVGQYPESFGWSNWIESFTVDEPTGPIAMGDDAGFIGEDMSLTIDVTANDLHMQGGAFDVWFFESASAAGGTVTRSDGTGTNGRDELIYTAPNGYLGPDMFEYTIADDGFQTSTAAVFLVVSDACVADFNSDGVVNTQDVLAFLGAWSAGDDSADINGDGVINTQDVIAFLSVWNAGCP